MNTISCHAVREGGKAAVVKPLRAGTRSGTRSDTRWLQKSQQYVIDENKLWPTVHPASRLLRRTSRAEQKTVMETSLPTYPLDPREKKKRLKLKRSSP